MPLTRTGADRLVVLPSPSSPLELVPQQRAVPSARTAQLWTEPVASATAWLRPVTTTGDSLTVVLPSPT